MPVLPVLQVLRSHWKANDLHDLHDFHDLHDIYPVAKLTNILILQLQLTTFAGQQVVPSPFLMKGGKSGQHRASYFLTGRYPRGYCSVTENNRPDVNRDKGEKVR